MISLNELAAELHIGHSALTKRCKQMSITVHRMPLPDIAGKIRSNTAVVSPDDADRLRAFYRSRLT